MPIIEQNVTKPDDLDKLHELTKAIIGQPCWNIRLGYGEELKLEIGEQVPYRHPYFAGQYQGAWMLGSRGTDWTLKLPDGMLLNSDDDIEIIKQKIQGIVNTDIVSFNAQYPGFSLVISFSNGAVLNIAPSAEDLLFDLAYWELFMPENKHLSLGPGSKWTYSRSDEPA
jgi:hypothetical protein